MKSEKGITLASLIIYIIVMIMVLGVLGTIVNEFYENTDSMEKDTEEILEFNKFNTYFLKEIKSVGNSVDTISNSEKKYILFSSGNSFSFSDNTIYYNSLEICKNVEDINFEYGKYTNGEEEIIDESIIKIYIKFKEFEKTLSYKIEEIY